MVYATIIDQKTNRVIKHQKETVGCYFSQGRFIRIKDDERIINEPVTYTRPQSHSAVPITVVRRDTAKPQLAISNQVVKTNKDDTKKTSKAIMVYRSPKVFQFRELINTITCSHKRIETVERPRTENSIVPPEKTKEYCLYNCVVCHENGPICTRIGTKFAKISVVIRGDKNIGLIKLWKEMPEKLTDRPDAVIRDALNFKV